MIKTKHRLTLLIISILVFGFLTANNLIDKHNSFEDLPDLLVFETSIYNTLKGHFLYNFRGGDVCHLGIHFAPMLLVHVPFYALYQNGYILFLAQGIMVGMGALGIYLLTLRVMKNNTAALILSIAFLLNPVILGGALWSIHEIFVNMFRHPMFFLETISQASKIKYLFNLFLPVAFICFFSPEFLLPLVPVILMNILSSKYK
jgi:uncharacterized membrane protein